MNACPQLLQEQEGVVNLAEAFQPRALNLHLVGR